MPIKRKVGLFLLTVIVAVTLGAALVVSMAMYRMVSAKQDQEIRKIETSLSDRFAIFEVMLRSQHSRIRSHLEQALPQIADEIERLSVSPDQLSRAQMDALAKKHDLENIYFIDRGHKIFQTTLPSDMNLQFRTGHFTKFLDTVYGKGQVMDRGIDFSVQTGVLNSFFF